MFYKENKLIYAGKQDFSSYAYSLFSVVPVHEPKDNTLPTDWNVASCRDYIGLTMRVAIINGSLKTDKLRLLFVWSNFDAKRSEDWCGRGLSCLHAFEKLAGWPLTKAIRVDMPKSNLYGVYVQASRRWLKTSYLVTLYILLMRMCDDEKFSNIKNFDDLMKIINSTETWKRDQVWINGTARYWKAIALGYPYLFEQYKIDYYWSNDRISFDGYGEGIHRLCTGTTNWSEAYKRLCEVKADIDKNGKLTLKRGKTKKK